MESRLEEQEEDTPRSPPETENIDSSTTTTKTTDTTSTAKTTDTTSTAKTTDTTSTAKTTDTTSTAACSTLGTTKSSDASDHQTDEDKTEEETSAGDEEKDEEDEEDEEGDRGQDADFQSGAVEFVSEQKSWTPSSDRPAPPSSLALSGSRPKKKKVLVAPALSLSLGRSESTVSDDFPPAFLSPSPEDDDTGLDLDLDAIETPSDSESLPFPIYDLDLEGYYGDGMNDIIVFSSCYLPENRLENYPYVMDNLFRYVIGTLDLMVAENYVIVYLCAGGQKDKLPGISWLRECYTTIDRRLRKNLKGFYVVHPTWYIKALATIIKPFISSKFSRKLQFVDSLQDLSHFVPTEHVQIPDCVAQYDQTLSR